MQDFINKIPYKTIVALYRKEFNNTRATSSPSGKKSAEVLHNKLISERPRYKNFIIHEINNFTTEFTIPDVKQILTNYENLPKIKIFKKTPTNTPQKGLGNLDSSFSNNNNNIKIQKQLNEGIWNYDIEKYMNQYHKNGFKGVFAINQLQSMQIKPNEKQISFVMNLMPSNISYRHWIGVFINKNNLEYYDPLAQDPPQEFFQ